MRGRIKWVKYAPNRQPSDHEVVEKLSTYFYKCPYCSKHDSKGDVWRKNIYVRRETYRGLWTVEMASYQGGCKSCGSVWNEYTPVPGTMQLRKITKKCMIPISIMLTLLMIVAMSVFKLYEMFAAHPEGFIETSDKNKAWFVSFVGCGVCALAACACLGITINMVKEYRNNIKNEWKDSDL